MHSQVGNTSPVYCTGIGKAMLAKLDHKLCQEKAERIRYHRHTKNTLYTSEMLIADIEQIRLTGISHDREEHETGICCVAAGIISPDNEAVYGVSVTAPTFRLSIQETERWQMLVKQAAEAIESNLAARLGPRSSQ